MRIEVVYGAVYLVLMLTALMIMAPLALKKRSHIGYTIIVVGLGVSFGFGTWRYYQSYLDGTWEHRLSISTFLIVIGILLIYIKPKT